MPHQLLKFKRVPWFPNKRSHHSRRSPYPLAAYRSQVRSRIPNSHGIYKPIGRIVFTTSDYD
eukprot:scaffold3235_cov83-Cylindrotheca_fusiformis.AAC.5